jgi:hypothetical protein
MGPSRGEVSMGNEDLTGMECGGMGTKGVRVIRGDEEISTGYEQGAR